MSYTVPWLKEHGQSHAMRFLLAAVHDRRVVTYNELKWFLRKQLPDAHVFSPHVGPVVEHMMDTLRATDPKAPLLSMLVVNSGTRVPGKGAGVYLERDFGQNLKTAYETLSRDEKRAWLAHCADAVFRYPEWDALYRKAFPDGKPLNVLEDRKVISPEEEDGKSRRSGFGGPAESEEHKALKEFIAKSPQALHGRFRSAITETESRLLSGDEIDVLVDINGESTAVEVKSIRSNHADFERGIYQCVKYRAVLAAQYPSTNRSFNAWLVTERNLTPDLKALSKRLGIQTKVVQVNKPRT